MININMSEFNNPEFEDLISIRSDTYDQLMVFYIKIKRQRNPGIKEKVMREFRVDVRKSEFGTSIRIEKVPHEIKYHYSDLIYEKVQEAIKSVVTKVIHNFCV